MGGRSSVWFFLIGVVALHATLISCSVHPNESANSINAARPPLSPRVAKPDSPIPPSIRADTMVEKLARQFSIKFFKDMTLWRPRSVVLSPLSFFIVLSMLSYGVQGMERARFLTTIGLREDETDLAKLGYEKLINKLSNNVQISTKMYYAGDLTLVPTFATVAKDVFKANLEPVSADEEYISAEKVNDWLKHQTNNECTELFKEPLKIGPKPSILLVNTVYFKGVWESPFDRSLTTQRPFHLFQADPINLPTMHKLSLLPYGRIESMRASFVELAYTTDEAHDAMSMFIILPEERRPTTEIMNALDDFRLEDLLNTKPRVVNLHLPIFKFEYSELLSSSKLNHILGEENPFLVQTSFSNLVAGNKSMFFGHGAVKYVIEIDEDGDKTTGLTGGFYTKDKTESMYRFVRSTRADSAIVEFDANHSFIAIVAAKGESLLDFFTVIYNGFPLLSNGKNTG